ncbi:hypothetical protein [Wenzhouxiangella sp. EGI_FJ10305]|uniref:hypothetical protein n=1 Tax=Wenzhouxiangella sp. EGI_FJ10305 TaxID=3243768 RepID=UPI0035D5783C
MHLLLTIVILLLMIPAALAGIGEGLVGAIANSDCLSGALPHASALLAELAPIVPALALLLAGVATLAVATWLIVRVVESA